MLTSATTSPALWYSTRATGIVALVLLMATMVLGILTAGRAKTRRWPAFAQADLHKRVSLLAMVFLGIHVLTAVLDTYVHIGWTSVVVPFVSPYQPFWTGLGALGLTCSSPWGSRVRCAGGSARECGGPFTGRRTGAGPWPWRIRWGREPMPPRSGWAWSPRSPPWPSWPRCRGGSFSRAACSDRPPLSGR